MADDHLFSTDDGSTQCLTNYSLKKKKKLLFTVLTILIGVLSCTKNDIDETETYNGVSEIAKERGLKEVMINQDANSSEICYFVKEDGDTLTLVGEKDNTGCATSVYLMKYNSKEYKMSTRFDESMRPTLLTYNDNVTISFDWIDDNSAVVKAYDPETNTYITTVWNKDENPTKALAKSAPIVNHSNTRTGDLKLTIKERDNSQAMQTRAISVDEIDDQYCLFTVTQCDYPTDASTWIGLISAKPYKWIENLEYYKKQSTGVYLYRIPAGSYPAQATNQELCTRIDWGLEGLKTGLTWMLGFTSVADCVALVCASTGLGAPPAAILKAITAAAVIGAAGLQVFMDAGGTSNLMKNFNPDWYYKEYITSNLILSPHIITSKEVIDCEKQIITPETQNIRISYDIDGDPTIDSFVLTPDFPARRQSYVASASFHCVPVGSNITMSIVGTDGYSNIETSTVNATSGTAELWVPGAETGVRDVCEIIITPPYGQSIIMTASLMFGF